MTYSVVKWNNGGDEQILKIDELPEAKLVDADDWLVRGSIYQDDDLSGIVESIEDLLAIYVKKKGQEEKVAKVAVQLSNLGGHGRVLPYWDPNPGSYGYNFWRDHALDVIDLVNGA